MLRQSNCHLLDATGLLSISSSNNSGEVKKRGRVLKKTLVNEENLSSNKRKWAFKSSSSPNNNEREYKIDASLFKKKGFEEGN
jgi:hypothetical protein